MYESFYGFTEKPFSLLPDPEFIYLGEKHSSAYAMLEYGLMNKAGFTVITGEVGSGKTTLIRRLLDQIDDDITVGLISNTPKDIGQLLQWVLMAFDQEFREESRVVLYDQFNNFLIDQYAQNKRTVLIIDEAQNLHPHVLEELRMLSNINVDKHQVLQLILVGQPQLLSLLKKPELLQIRQRITSDYFLKSLDRDETGHYILHRIWLAGVQKHLFDQDAIDLIFEASQGVPRVINILCDTALVYGFAEQKHQIDKMTVQAVLDDKVSAGGLIGSTSQDEEPEKPVEEESPVFRRARRKIPVAAKKKPQAPSLDKNTVKHLFSKD